MPDIFISYSSKDREQAELLMDLLDPEVPVRRVKRIGHTHIHGKEEAPT